MNSLKALLLATFIAGSPVLAKDLADVEHYLKELLNTTQGKNILLVLDVDGTLTNHSVPGPHTTAPRGNAVQFVKNMLKKDVNVVVSSAWHSFEETRQRLGELGLLDTLRAHDAGSCQTSPLHLDSVNTDFNYCTSGLVSSVQDPRVDKKYFRQKAFAFIPVYQNIDYDQITHVVFADDSGLNIKYFQYDLQRSHILENAEVVLFQLSRVNGEPDSR